VAFSPDGASLAVSTGDGSSQVWRLPARTAAGAGSAALQPQLAFDVTTHRAAVTSIAYTAHGSTLANSSSDATAQMLDATTGRVLLTLSLNKALMPDVAVSPDGRRLATASLDGAVRVYVLPIDELIALARDRLTRGFTLEECRSFLHLETCPAP